jgi:hypothetical protein
MITASNALPHPPGAECLEILQRWTEDHGLQLVQIPMPTGARPH